MKTIAVGLAIAVFICFSGSECQQNNRCVKKFLKCIVNGAPPEKFFNVSVSCCEKLLTNVTYSFLETYTSCFWEFEKPIAGKCLEESGRYCRKVIPRTLARDAMDYQAFIAEIIKAAEPPTDPEGCSQFTMDYGKAFHDLCLNNTKADLKDLCSLGVKQVTLW